MWLMALKTTTTTTNQHQEDPSVYAMIVNGCENHTCLPL